MPASVTAVPTAGVHAITDFRFDIADTPNNTITGYDPAVYPTSPEVRYYLAYEFGGEEFGRSQVFSTSPDEAFQIYNFIFPYVGTWTVHLYDTADNSIATTTVVISVATMTREPKARRQVRAGITDGTEMQVIAINENRTPESRCIGTIAMVTRDSVAAQTTISWLLQDLSFMGAGEYVQRFIIQGNVLVHQRNECISKMDGDWILFIDSDMSFQPSAISTLVETQRKFDLDMVGGLCFQRTPPYQPTLYVKAANAEHGYTYLEQYDPDAAVEVDATGMAFCLVHKRVFDRILMKNTGEGFPELKDRSGLPPPPFFRWEGEYGEDFLFCREATASGSRIFVDTSVKIGHIGMTTITEETFLREIAFRDPESQTFRETQLKSVGHGAMTPEDARAKLGMTWK